MKKKFYLTTPLYYVNDILHLGHAYCTIAADVLARYHRLKNEEVYFLTGTDEHGLKISQSAEKASLTPQQWADRIVEMDQKLWKLLNISYDDFIRTTEPRHRQRVSAIFGLLYQKGDIYKGLYEGWYCTPCETYWMEKDLTGDKKVCPDCGREVETITEENYFFRLSKYQQPLLEYYGQNPDFIQPSFRQQEIINIVKEGLKEQSVSRPAGKVDWAIPVPFDPTQTIYVWFDALLNYITALGYPQPVTGTEQNLEKFRQFWPADLHLVGKEILKFHTIIWPAMLMSLELPLPRKVFGHGWWTVEGEKMSKSRGNIIDPQTVVAEFGVDAFRYFVLKEVPFGQDGNFSWSGLKERYNSELANDLGNLLSRVLKMLDKYFAGKIPEPVEVGEGEKLREIVALLPARLEKYLENLQFNQGLDFLRSLVEEANRYIDRQAPWKLYNEITTRTTKLSSVLYNVSEVLRLLAIAFYPFMPQKMEELWSQLGVPADLKEQGLPDLAWGGLTPGIKIRPGEILFPRKK